MDLVNKTFIFFRKSAIETIQLESTKRRKKD